MIDWHSYFWPVVPTVYRDIHEKQQKADNGNNAVIISTALAVVSAIYFVQHGIWSRLAEDGYPGLYAWYLYVFSFGLCFSLGFRFLKAKWRTRYFRYYVITMLHWVMALCYADLYSSGDYAAYALGTIPILLTYRAPIRFYSIILAYLGALVIGGWYVVAQGNISIFNSFPIVVTTVVIWFIVASIETSRTNNLLLTRQVQEANSELRELSFRDTLTGVHNRRYLLEVMEKQIQISDNTDLPLSVLLLDVDHFKEINDRLGHAVGDSVLKELSNLLQVHIRSSDIVARYGGEEFIILLTNTDRNPAISIADKLIDAVRYYDFLGVDWDVTASIGAVTYEKGETIEGLIERADALLYQAKDEGRNRYLHAANA